MYATQNGNTWVSSWVQFEKNRSCANSLRPPLKIPVPNDEPSYFSSSTHDVMQVWTPYRASIKIYPFKTIRAIYRLPQEFYYKGSCQIKWPLEAPRTDQFLNPLSRMLCCTIPTRNEVKGVFGVKQKHLRCVTFWVDFLCCLFMYHTFDWDKRVAPGGSNCSETIV